MATVTTQGEASESRARSRAAGVCPGIGMAEATQTSCCSFLWSPAAGGTAVSKRSPSLSTKPLPWQGRGHICSTPWRGAAPQLTVLAAVASSPSGGSLAALPGEGGGGEVPWSQQEHSDCPRAAPESLWGYTGGGGGRHRRTSNAARDEASSHVARTDCRMQGRQ